MFQNFKRLATGLPIDDLIHAIESQPELWGQITARQDTPGSPHRYTDAIFLRWCQTLTVSAAFTEVPAIDFPAYEHLPQARKLVDYVFHAVGGLELGRVLVVSLDPGGHIEIHSDQGAYADHFERFHISLKSESGNIFAVDVEEGCGEHVHMKPGELWWFNHKAEHYLYNGSDSPRVHLIVDCVAPSFRRERT